MEIIMKEKLIRFMQGRYGMDQFAKFTSILSLILLLFFGFFPNIIGYTLSLGLLVYTYFRIFSKNYTKRYNENQIFQKYSNRVHFIYNHQKSLMVQNKTHHIYKCPSCKQKIRIPKGKGKIQIKCPKCSTEFVKRS
jgi:DNA-directed RNA polymerase subunit RPC12/RpoP